MGSFWLQCPRAAGLVTFGWTGRMYTAVAELPSIEQRMATILNLVAEEIRPCKSCAIQLAFVRHRNGKVAPYTLDGINHFINCPAAEEYRRKKAAADRRLF